MGCGSSVSVNATVVTSAVTDKPSLARKPVSRVAVAVTRKHAVFSEASSEDEQDPHDVVAKKEYPDQVSTGGEKITGTPSPSRTNQSEEGALGAEEMSPEECQQPKRRKLVLGRDHAGSRSDRQDRHFRDPPAGKEGQRVQTQCTGSSPYPCARNCDESEDEELGGIIQVPILWTDSWTSGSCSSKSRSPSLASGCATSNCDPS